MVGKLSWDFLQIILALIMDLIYHNKREIDDNRTKSLKGSDIMTAMREHAIEMVKRIPEDKMYYIVNILENLEGLVAPESIVEKSESQIAYQELQKYRRKGTTDRNYKEELYTALEEKYEGVN